MRIPDPIEAAVDRALGRRGVDYRVGETTGEPDFICDLASIECKQFYSARIVRQLRTTPQLIVIQGREAAALFELLLAPHD